MESVDQSSNLAADWTRVALDHALTATERDHFEEHGYVMLPARLDPATVRELGAVAAALARAQHEQPGVHPRAVLNLHDLVGRDPVFEPLIDDPTVLPKVWGVLGWNIQLFHTQLVVAPPAPADAAPGGYGWHQDNNRMNLDFETQPPHPRVSVKVGYLVSDARKPGSGNLCVVPGSHRWGRPQLALGSQPEGWTEIRGRAGDAVLFDRRLWHSASSNRSPVDRVAVFFGYSYRWLRPKSAMDAPTLVEAPSPIRHQLLGASTGSNGYFDPTDEDVPLRAWLTEHVGDDEARAPGDAVTP